MFRIALANLQYPSSADESVTLAADAIAEASALSADIVAFPECFVPGYPRDAGERRAVTAAFLDRAWKRISDAAHRGNIAVVLGTERVEEGGTYASALVVNRDGTHAGFQDKVQIDRSEEALYAPGVGRRVFTCGSLTFGIVICHEGWRYPETVRYASLRGASVVFHPHYHGPDGSVPPPARFPEPGSFFEKAMICRAAENACFFASINYAIPGSTTTSAVIAPDGSVVSWHHMEKPACSSQTSNRTKLQTPIRND